MLKDDSSVACHDALLRALTLSQTKDPLAGWTYFRKKFIETNRSGDAMAWLSYGSQPHLELSPALRAGFVVTPAAPMTLERTLQSIHPKDRERVRLWSMLPAGYLGVGKLPPLLYRSSMSSPVGERFVSFGVRFDATTSAGFLLSEHSTETPQWRSRLLGWGAVEALRQTENLIEFGKLSPSPLLVVDASTSQIRWANTEFAQALEKPTSTFVGLAASNIFSKSNLIAQLRHKVSLVGFVEEHSVLLKLASGQLRLLQCSVRAVLFQGKVSLLLIAKSGSSSTKFGPLGDTAHLAELKRELQHRVANHSQAVSSLLVMQAGASTEKISRALLRVNAQLQSMITIEHETKISGDQDHARAATFVARVAQNAMSTGKTDQIELRLQLQDFSLSVDLASRCGAIVNELVGNCVKHAFFPTGATVRREKPVVQVAIRRRISTVVLTISDNGRGSSGKKLRGSPGSGLRLVRKMTAELNGSIRFQVDGGLQCTLEFEAP